MKQIAILLCVAAGLLGGCRVSDKRVMTVRLPGMGGIGDQARIERAVGALPGVDKTSLVFDQGARTLTVRYDSMQVAQKNIEIAIAEAGYDANDIPAIGKK